MNQYEFHVEVVTDDGQVAYELSIYRDGKLDQDVRLLDFKGVSGWIERTLETATEDYLNAQR